MNHVVHPFRMRQKFLHQRHDRDHQGHRLEHRLGEEHQSHRRQARHRQNLDVVNQNLRRQDEPHLGRRLDDLDHRHQQDDLGHLGDQRHRHQQDDLGHLGDFGRLKMGYCLGGLLGAECPCLARQQMGCFLGAECQEQNLVRH